jgi:uncharacterized protein YcfJ
LHEYSGRQTWHHVGHRSSDSCGVANAGSVQHAHSKKDHIKTGYSKTGYSKTGHVIRHDLYEYDTVLEIRPLYREGKVSEPVRECWDEPVYHTRREHSSVSGMLARGLIGGVVGYQVGGGRGNKIATVGTLIGAQIGHQAVNGDGRVEKTSEAYQEHCKPRYRASYGEAVDDYDVIYEYRGREYQRVMPCDPGEHIKMRIEFAPVI